MKLSDIYDVLNGVLAGKIFYALNVYDNDESVSMPYIVYQEISKRAGGYHDDRPIFYNQSIQITLVTKNKDMELERKLEKALLSNGFNYSLLSEYTNSDKSINRAYEINNMEE